MRYLRYLLTIYKLSQSRAIIYRVDYLLRIIRAITEAGIAYLLIFVFYRHTSSIAGWTHPQVLLIYGIVQCIGSIVQIVFGSIQFVFEDIKSGKLDRFLTLPMNSLWLVSTKISYVTNVFRFTIGLIVFINAATTLKLDWTLVNTLTAFISLISASVIYYALFALASIAAFWTYNGDLWFLMDTISSIMRYPVDIFGPSFRWLLYVVPLAFIATIPAKAMMGQGLGLALISPLIALISLLILKKVWSLGLRSYEGASG